ncbi:hypothetical protein Tco_1003394 [Tanacetum coccineum]|uniref:Uncharacterized protein n=1 Tax=Tanacetum coccineum TaxID=301880 RepID=A0ABQ5F9B2_9ASTR
MLSTPWQRRKNFDVLSLYVYGITLVSYGNEYVAVNLFYLFLSPLKIELFVVLVIEEYDYHTQNSLFEFSIYKVQTSLGYAYEDLIQAILWDFLGVGTTLDIFQNIILIPYLEYDLDKDLLRPLYGKAYSLKRGREDKDKDEDPPARSDQGKIAKAGKPPLTFNELMSTPIDFSIYVLNNLKIENLTQEYLVGPTFNLLKGTCKSRVELEYHLEECYKSVTNKLYWTNLEGYEYPFDLSKPLPLIEDQGCQVVPANYFFNNDLECLKGGSLSSKYMTSTTKTKAAKYDTIKGIEDMVPSLWIPVKVTYDKYAMWGITHWVTYVKVVKKYDYGYLDEIIVRREDQSLHKFVEGDFPRLNLCDIEDMLILLV